MRDNKRSVFSVMSRVKFKAKECSVSVSSGTNIFLQVRTQVLSSSGTFRLFFFGENPPTRRIRMQQLNILLCAWQYKRITHCQHVSVIIYQTLLILRSFYCAS